MVRVILPAHLQVLGGVAREVRVDVASPVTQRSILDALESQYPTLRGTVREHDSLKRRPLVRFFACEEDWSDEPPEKELPAAVAEGKEPFYIIGAIAGG